MRAIIVLLLLMRVLFAKDLGEIEFNYFVDFNKNGVVLGYTNKTIIDLPNSSVSHDDLIICDNDFKPKFYYGKDIILLGKYHYGIRYTCKANTKFFKKQASIKFKVPDFDMVSLELVSKNLASLNFNDDVSKNELKKYLKVYKKDKLANIDINYELEGENKNFFIRSKQDLSNAYIKISKNLKSSYNSKIKNEITKNFLSKTSGHLNQKFAPNDKKSNLYIIENPRFAALDDGKMAIRLYFSKYMGNLKNHINVKGINNIQLSDEHYIYALKELNLDSSINYYIDVIADFKPHETYEITLKAGLSTYDKELKEDKTFKVTMKDYAPNIKFDSDKNYIAKNGIISFEGLNVENVNVIIDQILDENYRYFLNFQQQNSDDEAKNINTFSKQVINKHFKLDIKKNEKTKLTIKLGDEIKKLKNGIYNITIYYKNQNNEIMSKSKVVFASDIGISAKVSKNQIFVALNSLIDAKEIPNAKVNIYSDKNELIATGISNEKGVFTHEQKDIYQKVASVEVINAQDTNFLILDKPLNEVSFYDSKNPKELYNSFIHFASDIIRPNENIKALVLLKDKNFKSLKNVPVLVEITDIYNSTIYKKPETLNENGALNLDISMLGQKTGKYNLKVYFQDYIIANKKFHVESFVPETLKNKIVFDKDEYNVGDIIDLKLSSNYLFGSPASNLLANVRLTLADEKFKSKKYPKFNFTNEILQQTNNISYYNKTTHFDLNELGEEKISLPIFINQQIPSILKAQVEFNVVDGANTISAYENKLVFPYKQMVGIKLASNYFSDEPLKFHSIVLDRHENEISNAKLDVFIKKVTWHYNYSYNSYNWHKEYEDYGHYTTNSNEEFKLELNSAGDYVVILKDLQGGHETSASFYVSKWGYSSLTPTNFFNKNQVSFEDKAYKQGDTLNASIKSFLKQGYMIVSIEGDEVLYYDIIKFDNNTLNVKIPLNFDLKDGVYLKTKAITSTQYDANYYRASSSDFIKPDRLKYKQDVQIQAPKVSKSKQEINIKAKVKPNSNVMFFVVDEGILQITNQKAPKAFDELNVKARDRIKDYDFYDNIMAYFQKGKMLSFGAGDMLEIQKKHLAPKINAKRIKPFIVVSKVLKADSLGEVSFSMKIPEFNGKVKISVISFDENTVGSNTTHMIIKDDIILKPYLPLTLLIDENIKVPFNIFNTSDQKIKLSLDATTTKNIEISGLENNIILEPNTNANLFFNLKGLSYGKAKIVFQAQSKDETFSNTIELPVISAYTLQTDWRANTINNKLDTISFNLSQTKLKYKISVSTNPLAKLRENIDFLISYPYGCAEQTSSKILGLLAAKKLISDDDKNKISKIKDLDNFIKSGIKKLESMQNNYDGSFNYWQNTYGVNQYASNYTFDVLLQLKESGYEVNEYVINKGFDYLRENPNLYQAYLLSNNNMLNLSTINRLYDNKVYEASFLDHYFMAVILKQANLNKELNTVLQKIENYNHSLMPNYKNYGGDFYSKSRDLAFALYLHAKHFHQNSISQKLYEIVKPNILYTYSTQEKSLTLRAINELFKDVNKKASFSITINNETKSYHDNVTLEGDLINPDIRIKANGLINYMATVSGYLPKQIKHDYTLPPTKMFNIYRQFVNEDGKVLNLNNLKVGDLIYSKVYVNVGNAYDNVVIAEPFSSCFEIINNRAKGAIYGQLEQINYNPTFVDIRDDRILTFLNTKVDYNKKLSSSDGRNYYQPKEIVFYTPLRVAFSGKCMLPPVIIEAMYDVRGQDYDLELKSFLVKDKESNTVKLKNKW